MAMLCAKGGRTTAYHPTGNGLIERFHRHVEAALRAQSVPEAWIDNLPILLFGLRATFKPGIAYTESEVLYGAASRLLVDFITSPTPMVPLDPLSYAHHLRETMCALCPVPTSSSLTGKVFCHLALPTAIHAFVRREALRKPLQPSFDSLFPVLRRSPKFYTLQLNDLQLCIGGFGFASTPLLGHAIPL